MKPRLARALMATSRALITLGARLLLLAVRLDKQSAPPLEIVVLTPPPPETGARPITWN